MNLAGNGNKLSAAVLPLGFAARKAKPDWMSPRMAWRAIQSALPKNAIISSDIGNNCAIGNAYPTFEQGRKYLAPGLFGPCGYGFPAILGAKIGYETERWSVFLDLRNITDEHYATAANTVANANGNEFTAANFYPGDTFNAIAGVSVRF